MASKSVVFITGANTGLGYEIVKALCKTSTAYKIIIGSRKQDVGEKAISRVKQEVPDSSSSLSAIQIDLDSDDTINKAFDTISSRHGKIDVLINNAGASFDLQTQEGKYTLREGWNKVLTTNITGTQVVTHTFIPLLLKSSDPRLMFITSGTSSLSETERFDAEIFRRINDSPPAGWPKPPIPNPVTAYRSSKTGFNMMMREWHRMLGNDGVKVWAISPGFLATGLNNVGTEQLKKVSRDVMMIFLSSY